jgi:hypothetical protein
MSEFKGTPGPWETNGLRIWAKVLFSESQALELATMSHFVPCTERQATARLIAAAPDLLDALEAVVRVADRTTDEFDMARAAIARALGKE